jgi:hypothetical protein
MADKQFRECIDTPAASVVDGPTCELDAQDLVGNQFLLDQTQASQVTGSAGASSDGHAIDAMLNGSDLLASLAEVSSVPVPGAELVSGIGDVFQVGRGLDQAFDSESSELDRLQGATEAGSGLTDLVQLALSEGPARDAMGPIGGMFDILHGSAGIAEGVEQLSEDSLNEEGYFSLLDGASDIVSGAGFASPTVQILATTFDTAVDFGRYGDAQAAELGWLGEDETGHSRSWSDWAGDNGVAADRSVSDFTGSDFLGDVAGFGTTALSSVAGGLGSVLTGALGLFSGGDGERAPVDHRTIDMSHNVVGGSTIRGDGHPLLQQRTGPMGATVDRTGHLLQE